MLSKKAPGTGDGTTHRRKVVVLGFMGCGKSKVGRLLARELGLGFVDTDTLVEERAGRPVSTIFADEGESAFRDMETDAIATALEGSVGVIALGGGAATLERNWGLLRRADALTVYLKASPQVVLARVGSARDRPLLAGLDAEARLRKITEMLEAREPHYLQAELVVETDNSRTKFEMAEFLGNLIRAHDASRASDA